MGPMNALEKVLCLRSEGLLREPKETALLCFFVPLLRFCFILGNFVPAREVDRMQVIAGKSRPAAGGFFVPIDGFCRVDFDS